MKSIFGILFFVIFLVPGMYLAGFASELVDTLQLRFDSPDQHAQVMRFIEFGVSIAVGCIGAIVGVIVAGRVKPLFFRKSL